MSDLLEFIMDHSDTLKELELNLHESLGHCKYKGQLVRAASCCFRLQRMHFWTESVSFGSDNKAKLQKQLAEMAANDLDDSDLLATDDTESDNDDVEISDLDGLVFEENVVSLLEEDDETLYDAPRQNRVETTYRPRGEFWMVGEPYEGVLPQEGS